MEPRVTGLAEVEAGVAAQESAAEPRGTSSITRSPWVTFFTRRLISLVATLFGMTFVVFLMVRLIPGDPARIMLGADATETDAVALRKDLGLDQPVFKQFFTYLSNMAHGDLGTSYLFRSPVIDLLKANVPSSLTLAGVALALVFVVSIPGGMVAAAWTRDGRHPRGETTFTTLASVVGSIPEFLTGTLLALVFAVWLGVLPIAGSEGLQSLVLPALALAIRPAAVLTRIVRVETLNVLKQDYMRTATSKYLPGRIVFVRHVLPNVLTAALTIGGMLFTSLIAGAVVVENVFGRSGVGSLLVQAILARDYPMIQGVVLFIGATVVIVYALVDMLLALIDRRLLTGAGRDS